MIWPLRRKRREAAQSGTPVPATGAGTVPTDPRTAPDGAGAARGPDSGRPAWQRTEPLRPLAASPLRTPTIGGAPLVTAAGDALLRPAPGPEAFAGQQVPARPSGTIAGIATVRAHAPAAARTPAEPPLREASGLPAPPLPRRARPVAEVPVVAPLLRADDSSVGEPRPAAPVEPAPPWMSGMVPGMSPEEIAAMFPGFTVGRETAPLPSAPAPPPAAAPGTRGTAPLHAPRPRPTLGESRRRDADARPDAGSEGPHPVPVPAPAFEAPPAGSAPEPALPADPAPVGHPADGPGSAAGTGAEAYASDPAPRSGHGGPRPGAPYPLGLRPPLDPAAAAARRPVPPASDGSSAARPRPLPHAQRPPAAARAGEGDRPQDAAPGGPAPPGGTPRRPDPTSVVPRDMAAAFARLYGVDVSAVPVHRGRAAAERAARMSALAFTEGGEVFLPEEAGSIEDRGVRGLLAHELTHAVQQRRHGAALPAENTAPGVEMELEAIATERYFRGDPGASAPEPTACDHGTPAEAPTAPSISWTPDTGMVTSGVQRRSADEITRDYFAEINELRAEMGETKRVSSVSELDRTQYIALELKLRKAGASTATDDAEAGTRPLDWAEVFAQSASTLSSGMMRPFYNRNADEQKKSRDSWREFAVRRGWAKDSTTTADASDLAFLEDDEPAEPSEADDPDATDPDDEAPLPGGSAKDPAARPDGRRPSEEAKPLAPAALAALYAQLVALLEKDGLLPEGSSDRAAVGPGSAAATADTDGHVVRSGPPRGATPAQDKKATGKGTAADSPDGAVPGKGPAAQPARPLDWAEVFAQGASTLSTDMMRPFYNRNADEQKKSRDSWREFAVRRGWAKDSTTTADASDLAFLEDDEAFDLVDGAPEQAAPAPQTVAVAPVQPPVPPQPPAPQGPGVLDAAELAASATGKARHAPPVEEWDETALLLLSARLYPLLVDDLRRELLTGHQRQGFT
ncbi:DUF4157 domain-containing protein [Streptomyces sp. NPDC059918]|uniref:eCIS core domain-containing protein n=1 Tax=unclassified Streptomyces TaxID=2593676 RepID=UPI00365F6BE1